MTIDIIHGTGLETHSINTFLMASPCYGGRGHVICALFGIMAGVATSEATTASSELLRTAVQMVPCIISVVWQTSALGGTTMT